jgi:phosphoribosyl-AMP cyclohydrolase / phosphoribosyl-ATP pyrophosphohydrolase
VSLYGCHRDKIVSIDITKLRFDKNGLIPAIVQDALTHEVLTLAYMNEESLRRTLETDQTWFWSRSRNELWHKGETSGNTQSVVELILDCDYDAVLVRVNPTGPACHTGLVSCFHNAIVQKSPSEDSQKNPPANQLGDVLEVLYRVIESRKTERPEGSYTSYLFDEGVDKILKKVGEEASETIIAAKNDDDRLFVGEVSDLIYHLLVLMVARGITLEQIRSELNRRALQKTGNKELA